MTKTVELVIQWRRKDSELPWTDHTGKVESVEYGRILIERWSPQTPSIEYRLVERTSTVEVLFPLSLPEFSRYAQCGNQDCRHSRQDHHVENGDYECNIVNCSCSHYIDTMPLPAKKIL